MTRFGLPSLLVFCGLILLWEAAVLRTGVSEIILPAPSAVAAVLYDGLVTGFLWPHIWTTTTETLLGLFLGCSIEKLILAGYATDPLNYEHFDQLFEASVKNNFITGMHTKLLKISNKFLEIISDETIRDKSYVSISVDAGKKESYNVTHGIKSTVDILGKIYKNIEKVKKNKNNKVDINTTYLLTTSNSSIEEVSRSIDDLSSLGVNTLRFSFPQVPRNYDYNQNGNIFVMDRKNLIDKIEELISSKKNISTSVSIVDPDTKYNIDQLRAIPCYARFAHPAIGLDGYLYHCSESSSPDFHDQSLGNLKDTNFWDLYYSYNKDEVEKSFKLMEKNKCMCDRKLFIVNKEFQKTGLLDKHNFNKTGK